MEGKVGSLIEKVDGIEVKTDKMQAGIQTLNQTVYRISVVVAEIPEIRSRLRALEAENIAIRARLDNLIGLCEKLDKRIEILEHEYHAITVGLKRLEDRFERCEAERMAERIQLLEQTVAALEKRPPN
jgi:predicted nuclease with TOPRIM domain